MTDLKRNEKEERDKVKPDHLKVYSELKTQEAGALLKRGDDITETQWLTRPS